VKGFQVSAPPPAENTAGLIEKEIEMTALRPHESPAEQLHF